MAHRHKVFLRLTFPLKNTFFPRLIVGKTLQAVGVEPGTPFMNNCKLKLFILITKLKFSSQPARRY